jgi:hypothetical protein
MTSEIYRGYDLKTIDGRIYPHYEGKPCINEDTGQPFVFDRLDPAYLWVDAKRKADRIAAANRGAMPGEHIEKE